MGDSDGVVSGALVIIKPKEKKENFGQRLILLKFSLLFLSLLMASGLLLLVTAISLSFLFNLN